MTETVLQEAERIINGDRAKEYGDVTANFDRIARMWSAYKDMPVTPHDVAQMMILVKVARQANRYHRDSNVDIAGYAALDEQVQPPKRTPKREIDLSINVNGSQLGYTQDQMYAMRYVAEHGVAPKPAPRQWEFANGQIPDDVKSVVDRKGNIWRLDSRWIWRCKDRLPTDFEYVGPFTELLEDK